MRRGWEVNSSAAATGPAQAPSALSRLRAAPSGLASATAETWQTQPARPVHRMSPRDPCSVPGAPSFPFPGLCPGQPLARGMGHGAQPGRGSLLAWVPTDAPSHSGGAGGGPGATPGGLLPTAWPGMVRHGRAQRASPSRARQESCGAL